MSKKKRNEHTERKKLEDTRRKKGDKQRWITWISYLSIHKFLERLHAGGIKKKKTKSDMRAILGNTQLSGNLLANKKERRKRKREDKEREKGKEINGVKRRG